MTLDELTEFVTENGFPKFRAKQIYDWLYKNVTDFDNMRNIPADLKAFLKSSSYISVANIEKKLVSRYDKTVKYLFSFNDGECVESVVMSYKHGYSICISTQVGCKMGCTFCATGKSGFSRSLEPSEMLGQIETAQRDLNIRISNIVLMGMGEPLDNFDNVVKFLRLVSSDNGLNIGMRHITLSTCGIVPKIYELAKLHLGITLSVSLHAPNDEIRQRTMPIARKYSIEELLKACSDYFKTTGRRVTFEYSMISGVNDSDENARELAKRLEGTQSHVNLIPVNTVEGTGYLKSNIKRQQAFINILAAKNIGATVRRTLGSDINASCGQLKRKHIEEGGK
ncbi:23S rRNA (adenine(2503)-C(2))-methyltransferase RlmN [Ruminococcus sp. AF17-11]|jgi:23S rRNA (adenine2503-C2)-methyltransferase|nr:23S rRNA (adenine(2503)-C(2))-methyltransferase RlmN [Ruminococcus sp. AF17-11]